ncbi:MAG TPA: condensation domain-containing protein [Acidimicrobiales bacterium]
MSPAVVPLSFEQEAVLAIERRGGLQRVLVAAFWCEQLDLDALGAALRAVVVRHDTLRSRLVSGAIEDGQRFDPPDTVRVKLERADLTGVEHDGEDATADRLVGVLRRRPWDLAATGPLRTIVADVASGRRLLVVAVHYVASDAVAFEWLVRDLVDAYETAAAGGEPVTEEGRAYQDYVETSRATARAGRAARNLAWWIDVLSAERGPTIEPRPGAEPGGGPADEVMWSPLPAAALEAIAREAKVTASSVVLAAFATGVLACGSASPISVELGATPGRAFCGPAAVGNFLMPVRVLLEPADDPAVLVSQAHAGVTAALLRASYSVAGLVAHFESPGAAIPARAHRVSTAFLYEAERDATIAPASTATLARLGWERLRSPIGGTVPAKYLELNASVEGDVFSASMRYATTWFDRDTIERVGAAASTTLTTLAASSPAA